MDNDGFSDDFVNLKNELGELIVFICFVDIIVDGIVLSFYVVIEGNLLMR